ncbi:hypothetical protein QFZ51_003532 [Chitinophaga sp. W3I9]|uniref:hypothetical protein n=1 Tax=Chitinophaga sp. W3I9 TaxID=3373924 RepID=UPI003D19C960
MAGINRIQFGQFPVQEMKLNLFADYYRYYVYFGGMFGYMELDNPLCITRKLIFQLQYNKDAKCVPYVVNHFRKLKGYGIGYWSGFPAYKDVGKIFKVLQAEKKLYKYIEKNLELIIAKLSLLERELNVDMLKKSAEQIKNMILCDHEAAEHLENIIFHTKIIASEIIMLRHSKQEALELFTEIMTKDYRQFPYPSHIKTDEEKQSFFRKKGIHQTLDAIIHFCETPQKEWNINFKIKNLVFPEDYVFRFDQTAILPPSHVQNSPLMDRVKNNEDHLIADYFKGDAFSIAEVQANSVTYVGAYNRALKQLSYATSYMEAILQREIIVDKQNYFYSTNKCDYGYHFGSLYNNSYRITEFDQQKLNDNAYQLFDKVLSVAGKHFLEFEPVYIKAKVNNHVDALWHYLEILHNDETHHKNLKSDISGALVLYDKKFRIDRIHEYLRNSLHVFNADYQRIGLTLEEQLQIVRREVDISTFSDKITSIFFQYAYKEMKVIKTKKWKNSLRDTYYSLMEEAYEHRNLIAHAGKFEDRAETKLTHTFPLMVIRYRWIVFDYMKKFPDKTLKQILAQMKNDVETELGTS